MPLDGTTALEALIEVHGETLLDVAERSIRHGIAHGKPLAVSPYDYPSALGEKIACFVTLHLGKELRGCVGSALAYRALITDVAGNAYAAAFDDPRFDELPAGEADRLDIEVSLLGPAQRLPAASEAELIATLVRGRDGLILTDGFRRGLFLPAVWDTLPDPADFIAHLKDKAGITRWAQDIVAQRFETRTIKRKSSLPP
jgi:AmmeMemoRadiSam system protein A